MNALPVHPFTGLRAIGVLPSGKVVWPVMGGSTEDVPPKDDKTPDAPVDDKGGKTFSQAELDKILGERVAREKEKFKDYDALKTAAEELEKIKEANKSETEKAIDAARKEADAAARKDVLSSVGERLVEASFVASFAGRVEEDRATALISSLDKKSFLTSEGEVDVEKVKSLVNTLAPAGKGAPTFKPGDFGQGGNSADTNKGGTQAGADAYAKRHAKKST